MGKLVMSFHGPFTDLCTDYEMLQGFAILIIEVRIDITIPVTIFPARTTNSPGHFSLFFQDELLGNLMGFGFGECYPT